MSPEGGPTVRGGLALARLAAGVRVLAHTLVEGCEVRESRDFCCRVLRFEGILAPSQGLSKTVPGTVSLEWGPGICIYNKLPYDPAIPLLGIYPPKIASRVLNRYLYTDIPSSTVHNRQRVEATRTSIRR